MRIGLRSVLGLPLAALCFATACGPDTTGTPVAAPVPVASAPARASASVEPPKASPPRADASLPPRKLFFANPDRTAVKLSPDGSRISFLSSVDGVLNVFVGPAEDPSRAVPVTADKKRGIRSYTWAFTGEHVLYRQDEGGDENFHVHVVDVKTKVDRDLTPLPRVQARIEARSRKRPKEIVIALNDRDARYHDLWTVDVVSGEKKLLEQNTDMSSFVTDEDFKVRVATKSEPDGSTKLFARTTARSAAKNAKAIPIWEQIGTIPLEDTLTTTPLAFDATGNTLYFTDSRGRDTAALVGFDMKTRKTAVYVDDGQADVEGATFDPVTLKPQAAQASYEKARWHSVDASLAPDLDVLRELAKGDSFDIVTRTKDDSRWLVSVAASDGPTRYFRYDRAKKGAKKEPAGKATYLFSSHARLEDKKLSPMHPRVLKSRDGLSLVSYLTLPTASDADANGVPDKPLPMVLLVHGGPWARDSWGFSPQAQWLSSRGYAVLSVNFRGSTGFGKAFVNAADRQWGAKMHDDLLDAVAWAEKEGIAAPGKTAIMGGSYGGYATLVGLSFTPERFACGVDIVGPSNLSTLLETIPPYWVSEVEQFTKRIGDHRTPDGRTFLASRSPLGFADKIVRPLLIGQGQNDPRVKRAESDAIVSAMKKHGSKVTYVLYPDEGHGFARPPNRISFNAVTETFLAQCLGGSYEPIGKDFEGASITVLEGADQIEGLSAALPKKEADGR